MHALLLALALRADPPTPTYSADLEPVVRAARTLKCGMQRDAVKAAFKDVRPPDADNVAGASESIGWFDAESRDRAKRKTCILAVHLWPPSASLGKVSLTCTTTGKPGDTDSLERSHTLYERVCRVP
jgi:hypothetical protein